MGRMYSSTNPNLYQPGLRKVFFSTIGDFPQEFRQILNVINGAKPGGQAGSQYFDDLLVSSFSTFIGKPEGEPVQYDKIQQVGTVRYTPYTFGLGARLTFESMQDELYGVAKKIAKELAYSGMHQMEVQGHRPFNSGFGTAGGTGLTAAGFDSLALFSTAHTLKRGGTAANRATTDLDLSPTALEAAVDLFEGTVTESGTIAPRRAKTLLVPYQLQWIAKEIVDSELKPYSANNEVNPIKGMFQYMLDHYLTDSDSWFLLGDKSDHNINAWIRMPVQIAFAEDHDTGDLKTRALFRMAVGHGDWRYSFGSQGA